MEKQATPSNKYASDLCICKNCINDSKLELYFDRSKTHNEECSFCLATSKCLNIIDNDEFYSLLTALFRYHYAEHDYNTHWGGERIEFRLLNDELILNNSNMHPNDALEYAIEALCCNLEDYYTKIYGSDVTHLYAGHNDSIRECYFEALKDSRDKYLSSIESKILKENYFTFEEEVQSKIRKKIKYLSDTIEVNSIFYRARIGYEKTSSSQDFMDNKICYQAYKFDKISAPPTKLANAGRLNREGVSFLYLATDIDTAISEVRPDPGHKVSIGKFKATKKIKIANFDKAFLDAYLIENTFESLSFLNHIDQLFSHPITKDERHQYMITQFFADIFRKIGFDGIMFSSSISHGRNLLIFDPKNFAFVDSDESIVYYVTRLNYSYHQA